MIQTIVHLKDIPDLIGKRYTSEDFQISMIDIRNFECLSGVTKTYINSLPTEYPIGMIEGFHSASLLDWLVHSRLRPNPAECWVLNYGMDRLRFPTTITADDTLALEFEIKNVTPRNGGYLVTYSCQLSVYGKEKPAMVADWLTLVLPRSSSEFQSV